jgi:ABC-type amino acid transport substrate-binding protein
MKTVAIIWRLCAISFLFGGTIYADETAVLSQAEKTYQTLCSHCHGLKMVNPGTSSYDLRRWPKNDRAGFYDSVINGKNSMPAWGDVLLPGEIELLWYYVKTRAGKEPASFEQDAKEPDQNSVDGPDETSDLFTTPGTLVACLAKNGGVMSGRRAKGGTGLDYELSRALAEALGVALDVRWFESEQDEESTPVKEAYALLAYKVCDIFPGFALYEMFFDDFDVARAALPRWDMRPQSLEQRVHVDLRPISVTHPYARMEMGVVYRNSEFERKIQKISDMEGLKIGVEQGTLAGVLTLRQGTEKMVSDSVTRNPGPKFLWQMEQGEFDAALTTTGAYDFHKKQNVMSTLTLGAYRHPLGINLSIAMLESKKALRDIINPLIDAMVKDGTMAQLGARASHTYAHPRKPWLLPRLTMQTLLTLK